MAFITRLLCVCDSCLILKLFNCRISCTCRCYTMYLCVLNDNSVPTLDYLNCLLMLYVFISMYVLVFIAVSLNKQQTMSHIVTLNIEIFLLFAPLNMRINYTILVCTCSKTPVIIPTKRILSYFLTKFVNLYN